MIITIIAGIVTGFIVSVPPLGPIAFALISKGFRGEIKEGMSIAAGSAFMDMIYALIAFGGISLFVSLLPQSAEDFINSNTNTLQIILIYAGCAVVIIYGLRIRKAKVDYESFEAKQSGTLSKAEHKASDFVHRHHITKEEDKGSLFGMFVMGIMLCISSITLPASWLALVGYVKSFGIIEKSLLGGLVFSVGAFCGTILWFWLLLKLITGNKHRIDKSTVGKLNSIAGIILIVLGIFLFAKATGSVFNLF
jgi:arginine exporter protein ArgO